MRPDYQTADPPSHLSPQRNARSRGIAGCSLRQFYVFRSYHGISANPKHQPAAAGARHLSHAGRGLPRGGRKRACSRLSAYRHRGNVWQRRRRRRRRRGVWHRARRSAHHHQGLHENLAPDAIRSAFDASLKKLKLDHVDLYLVHWPSKNMSLPAIFETLLKLKDEGRTRAIGVANFNLALLKIVVEQIIAPIACNQIEYHVMLDQTTVRQYLAAKSIPLVAYCPLAQGKVSSDETLAAIGRKHGASAAQVALKGLRGR